MNYDETELLPKTMERIDIEVTNHGSVVMLRPLTPAAEAWVSDNLELESWQWFGGAAAIEPRYADAILEGMADDGLEVSA